MGNVFETKVVESAIYVKRPTDENWVLLCICPSAQVATRMDKYLISGKMPFGTGQNPHWDLIMASYE